MTVVNKVGNTFKVKAPTLPYYKKVTYKLVEINLGVRYPYVLQNGFDKIKLTQKQLQDGYVRVKPRGFQICIKTKDADEKVATFKAVRPSNSLTPYEYDTYDEAKHMARILYPNHLHLVRIWDVENQKWM